MLPLEPGVSAVALRTLESGKPLVSLGSDVSAVALRTLESGIATVTLGAGVSLDRRAGALGLPRATDEGVHLPVFSDQVDIAILGGRRRGELLPSVDDAGQLQLAGRDDDAGVLEVVVSRVAVADLQPACVRLVQRFAVAKDRILLLSLVGEQPLDPRLHSVKIGHVILYSVVMHFISSYSMMTPGRTRWP